MCWLAGLLILLYSGINGVHTAVWFWLQAEKGEGPGEGEGEGGSLLMNFVEEVLLAYGLESARFQLGNSSQTSVVGAQEM